MTFDEPVLFAVLSDENDLAVITNTQRFLGQIIVYDHSLEDPVFPGNQQKAICMGRLFEPGGDSIAVSSVQVQNGDLVSGLTLYRLNERKPLCSSSMWTKPFTTSVIKTVNCRF